MVAEQRESRIDGVVADLEKRIDPGIQSRVTVGLLDQTPVIEPKLPGCFRALFTTRVGGESQGAFSSLNLDARSEDDRVAVAANRARIERVLGRRLLSPFQVHGVRVAGAAEYLAEGAHGPCDGLTLHPELDRGLAAALMYADCVPLVLVSEVDMAVAHGGWRGILGGIVQQAGRSMIGPPATLVIGPSLGPCCFAVGVEVAQGYARRFGPEVVVEDDSYGGVLRVDLWEAATRAAAEVGIRREYVVNPRLCTACNSDLFYSYRKEGPVTGRHACVGWMAE